MTIISTHNVTDLSGADKQTLEALLGGPLNDGQQVVVSAITPEDKRVPQASLKSLFGSVHSGDSHSADNERIDADLAGAYDDSHAESHD